MYTERCRPVSKYAGIETYLNVRLDCCPLPQTDNVPRLLKWLPKASFIKTSFEALCVNEFKGASFEPDASGGGMRTGEKVSSSNEGQQLL